LNGIKICWRLKYYSLDLNGIWNLS
jgi:hypothetical protein